MSRSDTVFLDRSVTFRHGIFGLECHVPTWYFWIGVSRSDTVFLDRSVTFRHGILGSECHVSTRYSSIGVSCSDTIILKEKYVELMEDTQSQRTQLPKWFGLEAWILMCDLATVDLICAYFIVIDTCSCCCCLSHVKCYSWVHTIFLCILVTILGWPMILT